MRAGAPGSTLWLLRHEMRLAWRTVVDAWSRGKGLRSIRWRLVIVVVLLHALAAPIALALSLTPVRDTPINLVVVSGALLVVGSLMLSQVLHGLVQALYLRGDLDLVLSSPLPARRVLTVRALAVGVNAASAWLLLALPLVDMLAVFGQPRWLTAYPVLFAAALLATLAGLVIAMGLFRLIGARRTRTVAQVVAVLIGAGAFILTQTQAFLPAPTRAGLSLWLTSLADDAHLGRASPVWIGARALFGEPLALVALVGVSLAAFTLAVWVLGHAFAASAVAVAGTHTQPAKAGRTDATVRPFRGGTRAALLAKEWRLLVRDPWLISQMLMQVLYLLPLCFVYWRESSSAHAAVASIGMVAVVISGHLAGGLGWITIAAEDAAELLQSAPVGVRDVMRAKLIAALTPTAVIVLVPLVAITLQWPLAGALAALGCGAAAVSATLLCLWYQRPGKRRAFAARRKGSTVVNLAELALNLLWGLATATAIGASSWWLLYAGLALAVLASLAWARPPGPILAGI